MGNKGSKSKSQRGAKGQPIILNLGDQPMSSSFQMGPPKFSSDEVDPPMNVNTDPEFVVKKEAQYAACMLLINQEVADPFKDRAYGCIMGAFIGDSCGSYIEFDEALPSPTKVENCMKMPGGGYHTVAPGQVTDDSEMMMSLMLGYVASNENVAADDEKQFDFNMIGKQYSRWYTSQPFDIGQATETAIKSLSYAGKTAEDAIERANTFNASTKSNGSLMRCMPHAIFGANMVKAGKFRELKNLVTGEAKFVHANKIVHEAIFVYIVAIAYLLNNPDDPNRSQAAFDLAFKLSKEELANTMDMQYMESVNRWLIEAQALAEKADDEFYLQKKQYNVIRQMGFIKHAIVLSFYFLLMHAKRGGNLSHYDVIKEVISLAGDSDTNACIAGGMAGAINGFKSLDEHMVKTVLSCDVTGEGQKRPEFLSVGQTAVNSIKKLIECRAGDSYKFVNKPAAYLFQ